MNTSSLFWSLLFSSTGFGFFLYGKKQRAIVPLICGLTLMVYPYFVSDTVPMVSIGAVLVALPWFIRI